MLSVLLIGISLSMDAFAVTVANAVSLRPFRVRDAVWMAVYFGAFQCLMPLAGALLAGTVSGRIMALGPYVSFVLLGWIGVRMALDSRKPDEPIPVRLDHPRLLALAVATSIDALAVGVSFAFSPPAPGTVLSCALIGGTTFVLTVLAAALGTRFHSLHPKKAGLLGGLVLIGIGVKLLLEGIL